jgi:hypothetical protein
VVVVRRARHVFWSRWGVIKQSLLSSCPNCDTILAIRRSLTTPIQSLSTRALDRWLTPRAMPVMSCLAYMHFHVSHRAITLRYIAAAVSNPLLLPLLLFHDIVDGLDSAIRLVVHDLSQINHDWRRDGSSWIRISDQWWIQLIALLGHGLNL